MSLNSSSNKSLKKILALDLATIRTGWSVFDQGELVAYGFFKAKGRLPLRLIEITHQIDTLIRAHQPEVVVVENPFYSRRTSRAFKPLCAAWGIALMVCEKHLKEINLIEAVTVKRHFTKKGTASKELMIEAVNQRFTLSLDDDDIADAIALGATWDDGYHGILP